MEAAAAEATRAAQQMAEQLGGLIGCCTRRKGQPGYSSEREEYDSLKTALQKKQEEVRALQEQVQALDRKPKPDEAITTARHLPVAEEAPNA